jgi:hypothetical protein
MPGDYSRFTEKPRKRFAEVLLQQGRVLLDADWNELADILTRRDRTQALDTFGPRAVPRITTPDGFLIGVQTSPALDLTIGTGRAYVDGRLVEVFPGEAPTYLHQPFFPDPPPLSGMSGTGLVYLDVWDREVTSIEDPDLLDPALGGVDTTTRIQTVWQARIVTGGAIDAPLDCSTDLGALFPPSAGRLTTEAVQPPAGDDPCILPESGGYRGVENQLYRVEIHAGGALGTARFKWSRENASIVSRVEQVATAAVTTLTVSRIGRDPVLRFSVDDWVEILDDPRELSGEPGLMARVTAVNEATRTLVLDRPLPAGSVDPADLTRHTRVRRWDQRAGVDANGLLAVTAGPIALEHGIQVRFSADPAGGQFHAGDSWSFHARTAEASVEILTAAPPRAIVHHYCTLAVVTGLGTASPVPQDCRPLWPPPATGGDQGCDCSVCVTAESHNTGALTIQHAIDQVRASGGTVCLGPGLYQLGQAPLIVNAASAVRLRGHGWRTTLFYAGDGPALTIGDSLGVVVEDLALFVPPRIVLGDRQIGGGPAIALRNDFGVTVQRCQLVEVGARETGRPAITLGGFLFDVHIRENLIAATSGIAGPAGTVEGRVAALLTADLAIEDNLLLCSRRGISFGRESLHQADTRVARNIVSGCTQGGISAVGAVLGPSRLDVEGNEVLVRGDGIAVGTDGARISDNDVSALPQAAAGDGIALVDGLDPTGIDRCQVIGNRVVGLPGHGIAVRAQLRSAMIKQNVVQAVGGSGIFMEAGSSAESLAVENNQILEAGTVGTEGGRARDFAGIRLVHARRGDVSGNVVAGLARQATLARSRVAIHAIACPSLRIAGNEVVEVGPPGEFSGDAAGVEVVLPASRADVLDNAVRRSQTPPSASNKASWFGIRVRALEGDVLAAAGDATLAQSRARIFAFLGTRVRVLAVAPDTLGVRGNFVEAHGGVPAVDIVARGAVVLAENRLLHVLQQPQPVAVVRALRINAASNVIAGPNDNDALILIVPARAFTVLGNNTPQKNIRVGADPASVAPLGAPWDALNVK